MAERPPPIGEYTPQVPVEEGLRRVIPELRGASAGPDISQLGGSVERVAVSQAANYTQNTLSQAQGQWTQHLQAAQQAAPAGAPNFTPTLMTQYGQYVQQALKSAPNPLAAKMLQAHLTSFGDELQSRALAFESQARVDHNVDVATSAIAASGNELLNDPSLFQRRLPDQLALIDQMNLDPQTKEKLKGEATSQMARYATLGAIQKDPYAAALELASDNPSRAYTHLLSPELREQLQGKADDAIRARLTESEALERQVKEQDATQQDQLMKQGLTLSEQGQLTPAWINQHSALMTHEQMSFLLDKARGGTEAKGDPRVYSDLLIRAHQGEDVTSDAQAHLFSHDLTDAQFASITAAGEKGMPNWRAEGASYIHQALAISQLNPDPAHATSLANALMEWTDYERANPRSTPAQAQSAYTDIVRRYQLISSDQAQLTLPVPRFLVGSRAQPNIQATEAATAAAYRQGLIGKDDAAKQAALLQKWAVLSKNNGSTSPAKQ